MPKRVQKAGTESLLPVSFIHFFLRPKMENIVKYIFGFCLLVSAGVYGDDCDLTGVQQCVGSATDLVTSLYFSPLSLDLMKNIRQDYCDKELGNCLQKGSGNCTKTTLSPYQTIINSVKFVCRRSDFDLEGSCLKQYEVQHETSFCFQMFKVVIDNVISDVTLDTPEINRRMCRAYDDVSSCATRASLGRCNFLSQVYIAEYLNVATHAVRDTLECFQ